MSSDQQRKPSAKSLERARKLWRTCNKTQPNQKDVARALDEAVAEERCECARHVDDADEDLPKHKLAAEIRARGTHE